MILHVYNLCLAFSDDLLEDSDSEEHSRSESVTGRNIVFLVYNVGYKLTDNYGQGNE